MNHYLFEGLDRYMKDLKNGKNKKVKRIVEDTISETTEIKFKDLSDIDYSFADEGRFLFDFKDGTHLNIDLDMEDSKTYGPSEVIEEIKKSIDRNGKITFTDFDTKYKYSISDPVFIDTIIEDIQENFEDWDDDDDEDEYDESLNEDTIKRNGKWVNVGKDGKANSGKFKTKEEADAQRKAMFANGYKGESLEEETNMDKINRYLKSINEKPITEAIDKNKIRSTKSMNLYENINKGFERLYGDLDSNKSNTFRKPLTESKNESKEVDRKSLKEYKDLGQDLGEYQKYVDADMKEHGHISKKTMEEIKKAGLSVVKDQYGEYEVIAKEKNHLAKPKNESKKSTPKKKSREEIVEAYRRNLRKRKLAEAMARKREERKNR